MNKGRKTILIVLVAAGCLLMLAGWALADFDTKTLLQDPQTLTPVTQRAALSPAGRIEIITDVEAVCVLPAEDGEARVEYADSENEPHQYTFENDTMTLRAHAEDQKWYERIQFQFFPDTRVITVYVPQGFEGEVTVTSDTGNVRAQGVHGLSALRLTATTGMVSAEDCGARETRLRTVTGTLIASGLRADTAEANCTTGRITLTDIECASLNASFTTGSVTLSRVTAATILAQGSTGDIMLADLSGNDVTLRTSTGSIRGGIAHAMEEFTVNSHTSTGENNMTDVRATGARRLTVTTSTGDIHIDFAQ